MLTIHLQQLQFYAYHGVYEEETRIGGEFEVNLSLMHQEKKIPVTALSETINYVSVYELVKKHMQMPRSLLETVITDLAADIFSCFPQAEELSITITKKNPPIAAFQGNVGVTYSSKRL